MLRAVGIVLKSMPQGKWDDGMQLLIKQRVFSWSDTYDVYDEDGNPKYFVKAEFFSLVHNLHVYDQWQNEVGLVRERFFSFLPTFEIEIKGMLQGKIEKKFSLLRPKYEIDFNGWKVEGNFWGWDYQVYSGNGLVLKITKEPLQWGDTYVIDIIRPEDELMGLLLVIAIDAANCSKNR